MLHVKDKMSELDCIDCAHLVTMDSMLPPPSPTSLEDVGGTPIPVPSFGEMESLADEPARKVHCAAVLLHSWVLWKRIRIPMVALGSPTLNVQSALRQALFAKSKLSRSTSSARVVRAVSTLWRDAPLLSADNVTKLSLDLCLSQAGEQSAVGIAMYWVVASYADNVARRITPFAVAVQKLWRAKLEYWRRIDASMPPYCMICGDGGFSDNNPLLQCDGCTNHAAKVRRDFGAVHFLCDAELTRGDVTREPFFCRRFCRQLSKHDKRRVRAAHAKHLQTPLLLMGPDRMAADLLTLVEKGGGGAISIIGDPMIADFDGTATGNIKAHMLQVAEMSDADLVKTNALVQQGDRNMQIADGLTVTYDGEAVTHSVLDEEVSFPPPPAPLPPLPAACSSSFDAVPITHATPADWPAGASILVNARAR